MSPSSVPPPGTPESMPGRPDPLGAHWDGRGTSFCLFSEVAERVELCLFDEHGERRVPLVDRTGDRFHAYLPDVGPGQRYGYRVHGPWDPARGHRCNPAKLLVDPYAKRVVGEVDWSGSVHGFADHPNGAPCPRDSALFVPRSVVVSPFFDWGDDRPPRVPWEDTIVYELHVRGFTMQHPKVPESLRGTYAALAHPAVIEHLLRLGVTTVELMPVQHFVDEEHLARRGMRNHWGYAPLAYFAPHARYARPGGDPLLELKQAVRALHEAGIEVLVDVVYNHTCEGDERGPTLSFRGVDNAAYYRLDPEHPARYRDFTGCGNTLDATHPHVLQLIMDSLRYWVEEIHVDGFRFDLAAAVARDGDGGYDASVFLDVIQQDPIVGRAKLVAEPWDTGHGGYKVGHFPPQWSEWNGKYRDAVRSFWRGDDGMLGELATRLSGSPDLYERTGRRPFSSINFVVAHDGFTLRDLVSYEEKHNESNGEENRDGESHNLSWNCGVEGDTEDPAILSLRDRYVRSLLATLFLSQGVPLLTAGDEMGRTQRGNNNAYCHDDEIGWIDWRGRDRALVELTASLIRLRKSHPVLRRHGFFAKPGEARRLPLAGMPDTRQVAWFRPDGLSLRDEDWGVPWARALGVYLNGDAIDARDRHGLPMTDDSLFAFFCAHPGEITLTMPAELAMDAWEVVLDTSGARALGSYVSRAPITVLGPLVLVMRRERPRSSIYPL